MSASGLISRRTPAVLAAVLTVLAVGVTATPSSAKPNQPGQDTVEVQVLGLNDFHGAIEPPTGSGGRIGTVNAGGAEYLATHVRALRETNPNTLFVSAGDLIGATPLTSALFHDEPTIEAFNLMGLDYNGVGNHEFDEGVDELLRMQDGGCHPVDGCQDGDGFDGADFQFLAANVKYKDTGDTIFPPYAVEEFDGVKVGIIGMTLEGTPQIVTPTGIQSVDFLDEADSVNALVPHLIKQGVKAFVVLLHEGGSVDADRNGAGNPPEINSCDNPQGALPPIVDRMHDQIDVVVTGHTNWAVNCLIDGKVVTGAASNGRLVTDIDLTIKRTSGDVSAVTVDNKVVTRTVAPAADLTTLIDKYRTLAAPLANRVIGSITGDITTASTAAGESAAGDLIADAQLAASSAPERGGSVAAFMNPGGIRQGGFLYDNQLAGEAIGEITYAEAFQVQPFANVLTVVSCTGAQLDAILEQQWQPSGTTNILQVSNGFTYSYNDSNPIGSRVDASTIKIGGVTVVPTETYRVTTNNFVVTGGDGFSVFTECTNPLGGEVDIDALVAYFAANTPIEPGPRNRITKLN